MKKLLYLPMFFLLGCEMANIYSDGYSLKYRRPIGLMMSTELDSLHLTGRGLRIGVIDAGFGGFYEYEFTKNIRVADYMDFLDLDTTDFFRTSEPDHGTIVTSGIGGKMDEHLHGLAYESTYYLAKSEDIKSELAVEEEKLIQALEWMIERNVDIINLSIAYSKFDDTGYYNSTDLNGKTALISKYIDSLLTAHPKLIIVASAGNRGNKDWKHIMFPSDVKEIITVGSSDFDGKTRWKSSGTGVEYVDYIKPDVVTYPIPLGNSHTAPVIAGLCAILKEKYPGIDRKTLMDALHRTSSNSTNPNREIGYGVPNTSALLKFLDQE